MILQADFSQGVALDLIRLPLWQDNNTLQLRHGDTAASKSNLSPLLSS